MKRTPAGRVVLLIVAFALAVAAPAAAAPHVDGVFPVAGIDSGNQIAAGSDGNIWLTLNGAGANVARVTPGGETKTFDLENVEGPSGIATGPEGNLWITQIGGVARFAPGDPPKNVVATAIAAVGANGSIVTGPDGDMWVASNGGVVHFPPANPTNVPAIPGLTLAPRDIDVAGSLLAIADFGTPRIVTLTTAGVEKDFTIDGGSQGVAGSPSGQIAFSQQGKEPEQWGLLTPPNSPLTINVPETDPFGIALGSDGAYWGVQSGKDRLSRLTADGQLTLLSGLPAGSMPRQIAPGPNNTLWVTLTKNGEEAVARISGLEPPVTGKPPAPPAPVPNTKLAKGPKVFKTTGKRAKVKFRFSSTVASAKFECALTTVKKGKKAKKPRFKGCKSPKTFQLKPGKYRFSVRAVNASGADKTPATRSFRVVHVHKR